MQATVHQMTPWFKEEYANAYIEFDPDRSNQLLDEIGLTERDAGLPPDEGLAAAGGDLRVSARHPPGRRRRWSCWSTTPRTSAWRCW